ncbi:hypothetical protein PGT21_019774 [Puccinia graminis f. sp. tritici]|uniref:Zn(2)-C6 fungal-type domain-containing protein n=1 Tax=Puccinia graminis f. sp. tritici TaxID=56615 RepID=A0A5B0QRZ0_PUCGR|nr:hypothetical protein PGT21_019774 [Puccinia graminis f. sp. tritici]KAA1115693.1 hypothetical protein PGTUg99_026208 [Puccinia graminis f. sp. tritici]
MNATTPEPGIAPKRRRYRIPRSCDRCRTSKVKCVVENDRCINCVRIGVKCTFANPGSLKERPPTIKEAEQLEAHIRSLERLLHAVDPTLDLNDLPDPDTLVPNSQDGSQLPSLSHADPAFQPEHHAAQTAPEEHHESQLSAVLSGMHGLNITARPAVTNMHWTQSDKTQPMSKFLGLVVSPDQYIGPNSGLSMADPSSLGIPKLPVWDFDTLGPVDEYLRLRHDRYVSSATCFYPEPDLEEALLTIYFERFHPFVPVIHPTMFRGLHRSGLAQTNPTFRALCLLMFSIASGWSSDPRVRLDLAGRQQLSPEFVGVRFTHAGLLCLFQPGYDRATLFHLQAFVLLTIVSLGAHQLPMTWIFVERGLLHAQECGAHREVHHLWNADPLQDYLRRQAFFQLYEMAYRTSYSLGRAPLVEYDDFDLQPTHVQRGDPLGIFANPYSRISPAVHQAHVAFDEVRASLLELGSLKYMMRLLFKMQADSKAPVGTESMKTLKALVDQLDLSARKWLDKVPPIFKRVDINAPAEILIFSVFVTVHYSQFQMLIHQTLFHYQGNEPAATQSTRNMNPHIHRFVEFAMLSIQAMGALRLRGLLTKAFHWLPFEIMFAVILLVCATRKQKESIGPLELKVRRDNILLVIAILDELASSVHTAATYSKVTKIMLDVLDGTNGSLLDSLQPPYRSPQDQNPAFNRRPFTDSATVTTWQEDSAWDPSELSSTIFVDAPALQLSVFPASCSPPTYPLPAHLTTPSNVLH